MSNIRVPFHPLEATLAPTTTQGQLKCSLHSS